MQILSARRLDGVALLPPDKSIAHRAALFASLGEGTSRVENFPDAADPRSTLACVRALGVQVEEPTPGTLVVHGRGLGGWRAPSAALDCGNSGTTMRLIAGLLGGQPFASELIGDASLSGRPMRRVTDPLGEMGARIDTTDGHAPLRLAGLPVGERLCGTTYRLPVASAQVKSCVLLAGLFADAPTTVIETTPSRDHTERMLGLTPRTVEGEGGSERHLTVQPRQPIAARTWTVPADISAAAFFLVAGSIVGEPGGGSSIRMDAVGLNPTRAGVITALKAMGADIIVSERREVGGEPVANLTVRPARLRGIDLGGALIANLIDEIPVLAVAAACAEGRTVISGAEELRVKETDRIAAMATNLRAFGAHVEERPDGLVIDGTPGALRGAHVEAYHDHRIAMASAVAALVADGPTTIDGADAARISFPAFYDVLDGLRA